MSAIEEGRTMQTLDPFQLFHRMKLCWLFVARSQLFPVSIYHTISAAIYLAFAVHCLVILAACCPGMHGEKYQKFRFWTATSGLRHSRLLLLLSVGWQGVTLATLSCGHSVHWCPLAHMAELDLNSSLRLWQGITGLLAFIWVVSEVLAFILKRVSGTAVATKSK